MMVMSTNLSLFLPQEHGLLCQSQFLQFLVCLVLVLQLICDFCQHLLYFLPNKEEERGDYVQLLLHNCMC